MEDRQIQNGQDESFLRGAAKAAAFGAFLGAAVGAAAAASRGASEPGPANDEAEPEEQGEPETPAAVDEHDEPEVEADDQAQDEVPEPEAEVDEPEPAEPEDQGEEPVADEEPTSQEESQVNGRGAPGLEVVRRATSQLAELTGRTPEGVLGFAPADEGWRVTVEVIEMPRIPSSTDILAAYDVLVDESGDVRQWRRTGRYIRSRAETEELA